MVFLIIAQTSGAFAFFSILSFFCCLRFLSEQNNQDVKLKCKVGADKNLQGEQ